MTDEELEKLSYSDDFAKWLIANAMNYGIIICNGNDLTVAMENDMLFSEYVKEKYNVKCS
jgi:hypothetical protein